MPRPERQQDDSSRTTKQNTNAERLTREQLEEKANERIDAITAEPLHDRKFIEIKSPDGQLRLFYNTSTLLRIGMEKGQMMQPPHFREPMHANLKNLVEELEGKKVSFSIQAHAALLGDGEVIEMGEIEHRHMFFDQIIEEFYHLSKAEIFYCPQCYDHFCSKQNYPPARVVDPLVVLEAMDESTQLPFVVFRFAKDWKSHVDSFHGYTDSGASEYRVRDLLCKYYSNYNDKYKGRSWFHDPLTAQRYWAADARFNTVRYNRLESKLVAAATDQTVGVTKHVAFDDLEVEYQNEDENEDDFIADGDDDSEEVASCDEVMNLELIDARIRAKAAKQEKKKARRAEKAAASYKNKKNRKRRRSDGGDDDDERSVESTNDNSSSSVEVMPERKEQRRCTPQNSWQGAGKLESRPGWIAPVAQAVTLSANEREFLAKEQQRLSRAEMRGGPSGSTVRQSRYQNDDDTRDIDWENFGTKLPDPKKRTVPATVPKPTARKLTLGRVENRFSQAASSGPRPPSEQILTAKSKTMPSPPPPRKFLMDDEDDSGDGAAATLCPSVPATFQEQQHLVPRTFLMDDDQTNDNAAPPRAQTPAADPAPPQQQQPRTFLMDDD